MGEIADMMLDGTLDEETGEYIGDQNKERYGEESPGFPVSYERERREGKPDHDISTIHTKKVECGFCGKKVKEVGLADHMRDKHNDQGY